MSTLVTKKGIANLATNLCQRHVLAELFDRMIKGKAEPITPSSLASDISVTTHEVIEALRSLETRGIIRLNSQHSWDEVGSFAFDGITIDLSIDQLAMAAQTRPAKTVPGRDVSGMDQFEIRGEIFRATVLPQRNIDESLNGWFTLNIVRNPGLDGEFLVLDKEFPDQLEAWGYWDEWAAGAQRDAKADEVFLDWVFGRASTPELTAMDGDTEVSVVEIGAEEFERLVGLAIDDDTQQRALTIEAGEMIYLDRCYRRAEDGETFDADALVDDEEPMPEFEESFDVKVATPGGERMVAVNWTPSVAGAGVPMAAFEFIPEWDTDQVWRRDILRSRIPGEKDEFLALATRLAQEHYEKHGGAQS